MVSNVTYHQFLQYCLRIWILITLNGGLQTDFSEPSIANLVFFQICKLARTAVPKFSVSRLTFVSNASTCSLLYKSSIFNHRNSNSIISKKTFNHQATLVSDYCRCPFDPFLDVAPILPSS